MKVLHIIDLMSVGGAQFLIKGIFETYQNTDHHLFVLRKSKNLITVGHPNVSCSSSKSKYSFKALFELKTYIKEYKIEVLHCYLLKSQVFGFLLKKLWFPNIKIIFHELGEIFMNNSFLFIRFMKTAKKSTDLYFAASKATQEALHKKIAIPVNKIIILYNYVILKNYSKENIRIDIQQKRKSYNIAVNDFVIGYAGRLSEEKGPIHLINSLPFINHQFKLLIAGTGHQLQMLQNRVKEIGMQDKVGFLGFVSNMKDAYALFDILVIPSEHESFGLVAVEAQAMRTPVIASNIPGLNEVVIQNKTGLLFKRKDAGSLSEKINLLIEDEELRKRIIEGGFENVKKYDIDDYYNKMLAEYAKLNKN